MAEVKMSDITDAARRRLFVDVRNRDERIGIIDMLEEDGFVLDTNSVRTKSEIIEAIFPLIVNIGEKSYDMMGNATCAAAAVSSGALMGAEEFYRYYKRTDMK